MIIIPFIQQVQRPRRYREYDCVSTEIISVDCKINTIVSFQDKAVENYKKCMIGSTPTIIVEHEIECGKSYGFCVNVHLSADEYKTNRQNLEEYVCNRATKQHDYQKMLKECLEKMPNCKDYKVETFLSKEPDGIEVHEIRNEYKEYVPIW